MKLRVIRIHDPIAMAGTFIVQRRRWCVWNDMFYDKVRTTLHDNMVLGNAAIKPASFSTFESAQAAAKKFKKSGKRVILDTWRM